MLDTQTRLLAGSLSKRLLVEVIYSRKRSLPPALPTDPLTSIRIPSLWSIQQISRAMKRRIPRACKQGRIGSESVVAGFVVDRSEHGASERRGHRAGEYLPSRNSISITRDS